MAIGVYDQKLEMIDLEIAINDSDVYKAAESFALLTQSIGLGDSKI